MFDLEIIKPIFSQDLIRLGRNRDGGYLLNERVLNKTKVLISFGISTDWSFERDFYSRRGSNQLSIFAFDYSIDFSQFINNSKLYFISAFKSGGQRIKKLLFAVHFILVAIKFKIFFCKKPVHFFKIGISDFDHLEFLKFNSILKLINIEMAPDELFIKMDIEGDEFKVLMSILNFSDFIIGFVIEFHDLDKNEHDFEELMRSFKAKGYVVSHMHPNNAGGFIENTMVPKLIEITLVKSAYFDTTELMVQNNREYPIPNLDYICVKGIPDITIKF